MSEMKVWPAIHTLLVQFAPRIAEAEAASSYDERIAIINGVSAHIAGKVEEQIAARLRSMEEALKPFADRTCGFLGSVTDAHVVTARELLGLPAYRRSEQEDAARAALSGEGQ